MAHRRETVWVELARPEYQFRTVEGIARSTGLTLDEVREALRALGDEVRGPLTPDRRGRELYTLASRKPRWRERFVAFRDRYGTW